MTHEFWEDPLSHKPMNQGDCLIETYWHLPCLQFEAPAHCAVHGSKLEHLDDYKSIFIILQVDTVIHP